MPIRGKSNLPGQIKRRSPGSWTVILDMGTDPANGRRRQIWRAVKGPKSEAQSRLMELIRQRDNGVDVPSGKTTVAAGL